MLQLLLMLPELSLYVLFFSCIVYKENEEVLSNIRTLFSSLFEIQAVRYYLILLNSFYLLQGMSSYSTLFSGILMFIITYASPFLFLLSMVVYISVKDTSYIEKPNADSGHHLKIILASPCLVTLGVNSILLTAYTIVLLLMRNHLFVWSVFSPK